MNDPAAMKEALGGQSLLKIYEVFEKMRAKGAGAAAASSPAGSASAASPKASNTPSVEDKASAEALKGRGNQAMAQKKYPEAIDLYSQALKLVPGNPIYLSNRAAAYSASSQHEKARDDAQAAIEADPAYSKGWSRLGLAKFALGDAKGAMVAYEKGIQAEGKGGSEAMRKGYETAKRRVEEDESAPVSPPQEEPLSRGSSGSPFGGAGGGGMPDLSALAGMMGGGGGGSGGPGGMDFNSIMSNPMFAQMAQSLMSNPSLMNNLMNNPKIKDMMSGAGGGGMPDIGALMSDPSIAELAKNFMGPGGPSSKK